MKSSQALQLIGGTIGLGIVGVITTLLLTRDEDEIGSSPFGRRKRNEFLIGQHVPITLQAENDPGDPNPSVDADTFNLTIVTPLLPDEGNSEDSVYFKVESTLVISDPSEPTLPLPTVAHPVDVMLGTPKTFSLRVNRSGMTKPRYIVVTVSGRSWLYDRTYEGALLVTILPPQPMVTGTLQ